MNAERVCIKALVPVFSFVLVILSTPAFAVEFQCPSQVMMTPPMMEPLEAGSPWTPFMDEGGGQQAVSGMTILDASPENGGLPVPPQSEGEWVLSGYKRPLWVQCDYNDTGLRLVRPFSDDVSRCSMGAIGTLTCQ